MATTRVAKTSPPARTSKIRGRPCSTRVEGSHRQLFNHLYFYGETRWTAEGSSLRKGFAARQQECAALGSCARVAVLLGPLLRVPVREPI